MLIVFMPVGALVALRRRLLVHATRSCVDAHSQRAHGHFACCCLPAATCAMAAAAVELRSMVAGGCMGVRVRVCVYPLHVHVFVEVRMHAQCTRWRARTRAKSLDAPVNHACMQSHA